MLSSENSGLVLSFDGAAKLKTEAGSYGFVVWQLPEWVPVYAGGTHLSKVTVNEAEYNGLLHGLRHVKAAHGASDIVIAGDSRIVIQQCLSTATRPTCSCC
jgi:ribonuclease HI